jgi:hypothetical protein
MVKKKRKFKIELGNWKDGVRGLICAFFGWGLTSAIVSLTQMSNKYISTGIALMLSFTILYKSYEVVPDKPSKKLNEKDFPTSFT